MGWGRVVSWRVYVFLDCPPNLLSTMVLGPDSSGTLLVHWQVTIGVNFIGAKALTKNLKFRAAHTAATMQLELSEGLLRQLKP